MPVSALSVNSQRQEREREKVVDEANEMVEDLILVLLAGSLICAIFSSVSFFIVSGELKSPLP